MVAQILARQMFQFPIQIKVMTEEETKEYHRKKRCELSIKLIGQKSQLEEPNDEQNEWIENRMKSSSWTWKRWYVDLYLTEEQQSELGLTENDIADREMA